jgi:hypothetical protein
MAGDEKNALVAALRSDGVDLGRVLVRKAVLPEAVPGASAARILSFTNDVPALVERRVGAGRVLLFATTVDRDWTNLPITTSFLPLMQLAVRYLAGRMEADPRLDTLVGRTVELPVPPDAKRVRITNPEGAAREFMPADWAGGLAQPQGRLRFTETWVPGAYEIALLGMPRGDERRGFVVNLDAESESSLQKLSRKEIGGLGARMVGVREADQVSMSYLEFGTEQGLWPPLLAALVFLLMAECLLARKP